MESFEDKAKHQVQDLNKLLKVNDYNKRVVLNDKNQCLEIIFVEFPLSGKPSYKVIETYPIVRDEYFNDYSEVYHFLRGYKKQV